MDVVVVITACIIMLGYLGLTAGSLYLIHKQNRNIIQVLARLFELKVE